MPNRIIISLFLLMCSQRGFCEQQTYAPNSINIYPINVTVPKSSGWQLKEQTHLKVIFANTSTNENRVAYAGLFVNQTPTNKSNILEMAKQGIQKTLNDLERKIITQDYTYTDEFPYPCVRAKVSATKQEDENTLEISFQYRYLICVKPEENTGFSANFSYIGKTAIVSLDKEANEFITGVRFRSPVNDGEINALWNSKEGFGIWVYPETGACDEIRTRVKYFTVFGNKGSVPPKGKLHLPATDFKFCMDFSNGKPNAICKQGYIDLEFDKEKNEYKGYFELTMSNGMIKREKFRATYCDTK